MSKYIARGAQIFVDLSILSAAYWLAFLLRFELNLALPNLKLLFFTWPYVILFKYLVLTAFGVPKFSWRFVGMSEASKIFTSLLVASAVLVTLRLTMAPMGGYTKFVVIPLGVLGIDFALSLLGIAGARMLRRQFAETREVSLRKKVSEKKEKRTLLIGAGRAGVMVAKEVVQNPHLGIKVVGFIDDDTFKHGTLIQGHKVLGDTASIPKIAEDLDVEQAIISIAAASGKSIRTIVHTCEEIGLPVRIIPGIYDIIGGRVNLSRIREVTIEDLLGREMVELDQEAIGAFLTGKRVVVTGAGGSIGSELCRQVAKFGPEQLVLLEQAENPLFYIHKELVGTYGDLDIVPIIADVADYDRVDYVFSEFKPHVVFHAAAHKHVPMMEWNPGEAIKNNVFGTKNVADAADRHGAEAFVMISTDKAVNPTSVMGTTKRVAETYIQALSQKTRTKFVAVRFGNVLGSAGSVIPIFKDQIAKGGPVTVTHPEMKRYFMTIPEACQLVMQSATMGQGGEIFVLDMGEPVKIVDLARELIRLSGFSEEDIPIEFSGMRPGEKLFEELGRDTENMAKTRHPKIFIGRIASYELDEVLAGLNQLSCVKNDQDVRKVRRALGRIIPEMQVPHSEMADPPFAAASSPAVAASPVLN